MQALIIFLMLVCFILIGQQFSSVLYSTGLTAIIIITLCNMAFSNMRSDLGIKDTLIAFVRIMLIVVVIFVLGIVLAPVLITMGRRG